MSTLATLVVKLLGDTGPFTSSMAGAESTADKTSNTLASKLGGAIGTVSKLAAGAAVAGFAALTGAVIQGINATNEWANTLDDMGDVLGTTANESAAITVALKPYGDAAGEITSQTARLVTTLEDSKGGLSDNAKLLNSMGIAFKDTNGQMLPTTKLLNNIADKVSQMPDGLDKTQLMMQLFGKSGKGMSDALGALTTEGLANATDKAEKFGLAIGDDGVSNSLEFQKSLTDIEMAGKGLSVTVGNALLPMIVPLVQWFVQLAMNALPAVRGGITQLIGLLQPFSVFLSQMIVGISQGVDPFTVFKNALSNLLIVLGMSSGGVSGLGNAFGVLQMIVASIVGYVTPLVTQMVGIWMTEFQLVVGWITMNWPMIQETIISVFNGIVSVVQPILAAIFSVITAVFSSIFTVISTVLGAVQIFLTEHGTEIQQFFTTTWQSIVEIVTLALELINATIVPIVTTIAAFLTQAFTSVATFISQNQETIVSILTVAWNAIKLVVNIALDLIKGIITVALNIVKGDWSGAWSALKEMLFNIWGDIEVFFNGMPSQFIQWGKSIIDGLVFGLNKAADSVRTALLKIINDGITAVKEFLGISSPSKLFGWIGEMSGLGLVNSIASMGGQVYNAALSLVDSAQSAFDTPLNYSLATASYGAAGQVATMGYGANTNASMNAGNSGGLQSITLQNVIDGEVVSEVVYRRIGEKFERELAGEYGGRS